MPEKPTQLRAAREDDPRRVDIGALAGSIQGELAGRLAETLVQTITNLEEDEETVSVIEQQTDEVALELRGLGLRAHEVGGWALNHNQQLELMRCALRAFDGTELEIARQLKAELDAAGVTVWGLTREHETFLGRTETAATRTATRTAPDREGDLR